MLCAGVDLPSRVQNVDAHLVTDSLEWPLASTDVLPVLGISFTLRLLHNSVCCMAAWLAALAAALLRAAAVQGS